MAIRQYKDKDGTNYYRVTVSVRSKIQRKERVQLKKSKITSKARAERIEKQLYEEAHMELARRDGQGYNWSQIVEKWYLFKKTDSFDPISEHTLEDYLSALKTWTITIWNKPAKSITRTDIKNIIKSLDDAGRSKSFQSKLKGTINKVFTWGLEESLIKEVYQSPTYGIAVNRKAERVPTILNREEINKLLYSAKTLDSPWYPIWAMALLTGCRNGELFALEWDDVNFSSLTLRVSKSFNKRLNTTKSTKAGYWRNIPINSDLKSLLLELKKSGSASKFILPRLRDWRQGNQAKELKKFCIGIGILPIRFHDLRACFATQLLQNRVPPATVMKICGWKDLDTMGRYIRLAGIDEAGATDSLLILPNQALNTKVLNFNR